MSENKVKNLKDEIITSYNEIFSWKQLPEEVLNSFYEVDRHLFVSKYQNTVNGPYINYTPENIEDHLANIYRDQYLILKTEKDTLEVLSSISQPSLVLYMLALGEIKRGGSVLEIGSASGWNAALISNIVGPKGKVISTEIDEELGPETSNRLSELGYKNIDIRVGDGARGAPNELFDVVFYTVGIYDIPSDIYNQIRDGGVLILILKNHGGGDTLVKLRKKNNLLISEESIPCGFVQIQGQFRTKELQPQSLNRDSYLGELWQSKVKEQRFWFGAGETVSFYWKSMPFKAFLSIVEPYYVVASENNADKEQTEEEVYFGLYNPDEYSLALFTPKNLVGCGNEWAFNRVQERLREWMELGMPTISAFNLEARKRSFSRTKEPGEYVLTRNESQFFFSL